jgi:hypothetical protein
MSFRPKGRRTKAQRAADASLHEVPARPAWQRGCCAECGAPITGPGAGAAHVFCIVCQTCTTRAAASYFMVSEHTKAPG